MKRTYTISDTNVVLFTKLLHDNHINIGKAHKVVSHITINHTNFVSYTLNTANEQFLTSIKDKWNIVLAEEEASIYDMDKLYKKLNQNGKTFNIRGDYDLFNNSRQ